MTRNLDSIYYISIKKKMKNISLIPFSLFLKFITESSITPEQESIKVIILFSKIEAFEDSGIARAKPVER